MPWNSMESVSTKVGQLDLLATGHGVEVVRGSLKDGERINFVPVEAGSDSALEVCLLLEGMLTGPEAMDRPAYPPAA